MVKIRMMLSAALAVSLLMLSAVVAVSASAHTPKVAVSCDELSVKLTNYNGGGTNHVKVTIDGDVVVDEDFGTGFDETFDAPDKYKQFTYVVVVTAWDDNDPQAPKGWSFTSSGTSKACHQPPGHTPVNVCHATSSDTNPYVFITVDDDSVKFTGHLMHRNAPNKTWKSDGVFRGKTVKAGDPKPDLIGDYTDKAGVLHTYDGVITSKSDCGTLTPPVVVPPKGEFTTECTATGAQADVGTLTEGSNTGGRFELRSGSTVVVVTSGQQNVTVPASSVVKLYYVPPAGAESLLDTETSQPACTQQAAPTGAFTTECTATGAQADVGTLTEGTHTGGRFELRSGSTVVVVTSGQQNVAVPASATVKLYYVPASGPDVLLDTEQSPAACTQPVVTPAAGSFTTECTATGAQADVGTLTEGTHTGGRFELRSGSTVVVVTSGQQNVAVPASATVKLYYVPASGPDVLLDTEQSPAACTQPVVTPAAGSFTTECTATGAQADVGTLTEGTHTGGRFELRSGSTVVVVTNGQQNVAVPASATVNLVYVPAAGAESVLDTEQSPAACVQQIAPQRDLAVAKAVSPTGAVQFGATLTYTLTVSATGNAPQTNVVVTDQVPTGTTYVGDSASCDAGTCSPTFSNGTVTWGLGGMAAGTTRSVSFKVTVNTPEADEDGALPAVEVRNAGAVSSTEVPTKPSNEVVTPVSAVLGVKTGPNEIPDETSPEVVQASGTPPTAVLAATGGSIPWPVTVGLAALLLLSGIVLVSIGRRPAGRHTAG